MIWIFVYLPLILAAIAVNYTYVLTRPGEVLAGVYKWLYERPFFKHDERANAGLEDHPLFKVIIGCHLCTSGQWALWIYTIFHWRWYAECWWIALGIHIAFISITILFSAVIKHIIEISLKKK